MCVCVCGGGGGGGGVEDKLMVKDVQHQLIDIH